MRCRNSIYSAYIMFSRPSVVIKTEINNKNIKPKKSLVTYKKI